MGSTVVVGGKLHLSEKDFQRQVKDYALLRGWLYFHDADSRRNERGLPDTILVRPGRDGVFGTGRLLFCELKSERGRIRPEQKTWLEALETVLSVETYVWRPSDWAAIEKILL